MKFIPVRELRIHPGKVWKHLSREEVVVTSKGKPIALVTAVSADTLEDEVSALRRARALAALERIQRQAVRTGRSRLTDQEIEAEIKAARRARRK
ncbi:MAG: type II toxin-antitoxin system Phd/YefM family antitoxin [Planctomycetes bacterium]|nr:type II toxin-antitoxin system Phd/YefM family antitoxin [Planctomycetota bacterium]